MPQSWDELNISQAELSAAFEPNLFCSWAIALGNVLILHQPNSRNSILKIAGSCLFISLLLSFPIILIVSRHLGWVSNSIQGLITTLMITVGFSSLFVASFNYYLWRKAKQLKLLINLLSKVKQYNKLIGSFQLLSNINRLNNTNNTKEIADIQSVIELKSAFRLTKDSLLKSIELENYIYTHRLTNSEMAFPQNSAQILADLEDNLVHISSPATAHNLEYQQLLDEAVDLGLSIHQEIKKFCTLRRLD